MKYRAPIGIPLQRDRRWGGIVVSVLIHALIVLAIVGINHSYDLSNLDAPEGAGGAGPVGGGGGGSRDREERVSYVRTAEPPLIPTPLAPPVATAVAPPLTPLPALPSISQPVNSSSSGAGAGTGGVGPGSGGGTGSGVGTGKGTSTGPGTGGGNATSYPPTPTQVFLPPLPAPERIKPYHLTAWFEVDEKGNSRLLGFNESKDKSYNKRLRDVLSALRFRPGVDGDGNPVRDTVAIQLVF